MVRFDNRKTSINVSHYQRFVAREAKLEFIDSPRWTYSTCTSVHVTRGSCACSLTGQVVGFAHCGTMCFCQIDGLFPRGHELRNGQCQKGARVYHRCARLLSLECPARIVVKRDAPDGQFRWRADPHIFFNIFLSYYWLISTKLLHNPCFHIDFLFSPRYVVCI